ncbi:uncharacterized protein B0I36DRAFT_354878 [Microdochium trichocladiopsis]|uniref:Uncharacterized protein n=1 Tax=Microdochium trichocladiopsis TaxID=1682393 RepID=A0A9P9BJY6_9PEZI|nr:uncharacterized protein B0I36DRAFT_354878 [Microdochium trichocladiopsis]KAH7018618.1 hypothetical protein B0I36DRAFT_354878 [Microdochium trichocladiopsis]
MSGTSKDKSSPPFQYNYKRSLALLRLSKQIHAEAKPVFRELNIFVRVEAVWPEQDMVERQVPIVIEGQQVEHFTEHSLSVYINFGTSGEPWDLESFLERWRSEPYSLVLLADDLDKFTRSCLYARLERPEVNESPSLKLRLRSRCATAQDTAQDKAITTRELQRKLLMPFGIVKRLENLVIEGEPAALPSVEQELRDAQLVSLPTGEECLAKATTLKATGNEAIEQGDYHKALKIYREALEAIYYIVTGRGHYTYTDLTALFDPSIQ